MINGRKASVYGCPLIRAIVIDDSPTAQKLLVTILQEAEGIQVVGVGKDGEDAIRLTKRQRPDVVTMDVRMPKMDGLEATRRIMHETPTPIVIVTGESDFSHIIVNRQLT